MAFTANTYALTTPATANFNVVANAIDGSITGRWGGTTGGSVNAYTLTPNPAWTSTTRAEFRFIFLTPHVTNTSASTLNISSIGTAAITHKGKALVGGEMVSGVEAVLAWDGTSYELINHGGGWVSWTPTYGASGSMTYTSVTTSYAKWRLSGNGADFALLAFGTTGGTASTTLTFTLPATAANTNPHYTAFIGTVPLVSGVGSHNSTSVMNVRRSDNANLALSANTFLACSGRLELP